MVSSLNAGSLSRYLQAYFRTPRLSNYELTCYTLLCNDFDNGRYDLEHIAFDRTLSIRVHSEGLDAFRKRCRALGRPYQDVIREMMEAFSERRLRIELPDNRKQTMKETYNVD